jgi:hypothetical protein
MRIGIDFDNTLIDYDRVFLDAAKGRGLIDASFVGSKRAIRDQIRLLPEGELAWQQLQGYVYGAGISGAVLCAGATDFLRECRDCDAEVFVVSHKTQFGHYDPQRVDLRAAALGWMADRGFFRPELYRLARANIYFEATRVEKLRRIGTLGCTVFIDDLEEIFTDPEFPRGVRPILFAPTSARGLAVYPDWRRIAEIVLGEHG